MLDAGKGFSPVAMKIEAAILKVANVLALAGHVTTHKGIWGDIILPIFDKKLTAIQFFSCPRE